MQKFESGFLVPKNTWSTTLEIFKVLGFYFLIFFYILLSSGYQSRESPVKQVKIESSMAYLLFCIECERPNDVKLDSVLLVIVDDGFQGQKGE